MLVHFKQDGSVEEFNDVYGGYPPIWKVKAILDAAKKYVRKYKTEDEIERLNIELRDKMELDEIRAARERRINKSEYLQKKVDNECHIYLIKDTIRGVYKIGKAKNVDTRFSQIKTSNPGVQLVCSYFGKESDEKTIHSVLHSFGKHVDGEWFNMGEADIDYFHQYFDKSIGF
jgi:hypothetical protein